VRKIGTFTFFEELNSIVSKVENKTDFYSIIPIIYLQQKFNLAALYSDYPNARNKVGSKGKEKRLTTSIFDTLEEVFCNDKRTDDHVKILGLVKNQRYYKFICRKYLESHANFEKYKVFVPKSNGTGAIGEVLSTPLVGEPLVGHTQSFISIGVLITKKKLKIV
jgi:hypothetical protein